MKKILHILLFLLMFLAGTVLCFLPSPALADSWETVVAQVMEQTEKTAEDVKNVKSSIEEEKKELRAEKKKLQQKKLRLKAKLDQLLPS